jgi:5'-nucleotidase
MGTYHIVVTNDDGIQSPGLRAAAEAASVFGEVTVVAPTRQQTGMGRSLTGDMRARLEPVDFRINGRDIAAYHCDCSPALVVRHSLRTLLHGQKVDLLISGINYGENLGTNITCSGTVGAALEAASSGIPAIAMSKQTEVESHHKYTDQDWSTSMYFQNFFSHYLLENAPQEGVDILKIDVPADATPTTAWQITRLARTSYYFKAFDSPGADSKLSDAKTEIRVDPETLDPGSDIYVLAVANQVSVTPLNLDFTSRVDFTHLTGVMSGN